MAPDTTPKHRAFTIGALSKQTGCKVETIRYYERIGLLPEPLRSAGGHRLYRGDDLRRLGFIRRSRQLGFTLDEVRGLLAMVDSEAFTCGQIKAVTLDHLDEIRRKLADLAKLERILTEIAARCDGGGRPDCPIIEALFE